MSSHHASSSKGGDKGGEKGDKADSPHQQKQWFEREQPSFVPISEKELEMGECLGSGAFGQVYKAKYKGKVVAVKFTSGSKKKEFEAELRALMGVNHPNIIRLYGASIAPPRFFLVMELGSNSLHTYLRETSYEMLDVYKWALQIAEGMGYLHTKNILHRDLKTANILLDSRKLVKICDFGTSRDYDATTIMTFVGTVSYMAPELLMEQPVSEKIDVYSYAICLWEMITRKTPYQNMKPVQIMWVVANEKSRLPIPDDCPKLFKNIMESSWKQDPKERPSFKTILGTLMSAIGTDFEIKGGAYMRPLTQQQSQWSASIDQTIEGFKTIQAFKDGQSLQLQLKQEELAKKEEEIKRKEAELAKRVTAIEEQHLTSQQSQQAQQTHDESSYESETRLRRMASMPLSSNRGRDLRGRISIARLGTPMDKLATGGGLGSPASPSPNSPAAGDTIKRTTPLPMIVTSAATIEKKDLSLAPGVPTETPLTATPTATVWHDAPQSALPAPPLGHSRSHSRESSGIESDGSSTQLVATDKSGHSRNISDDISSDGSSDALNPTIDSLRLQLFTRTVRTSSLSSSSKGHSREPSDEYLSATESRGHSREPSYVNISETVESPVTVTEIPIAVLPVHMLGPTVSPSSLTAVMGDASVNSPGSSPALARPASSSESSAPPNGRLHHPADFEHVDNDDDDGGDDTDSVLLIDDMDDDDDCDDDEEEARKAALVGVSSFKPSLAIDSSTSSILFDTASATSSAEQLTAS